MGQQSKACSAFESILNIAVGIGVSFLANIIVLPWFGFDVKFDQALGITAIFTAISFVRSYMLRRFFNWLHVKGYGHA